MIHLGVLSYGNPHVAVRSSNIGDSVQSLAALNVYRHFVNARNGTNLDMETFLAHVINNKISGVNFIFLDRDNLSAEANKHADKTIITIMNGWFMHYINAQRAYDWPPPENVVPIMTSFHAAAPHALTTQKGIEWLKKHEPIGCRDKFTERLMHKHGVKAYFSGCLTTTIDFYRHQVVENAVTYAVDVQGVPQSVPLCHEDSRMRQRSPGENMINALALLKKYTTAKEVITSRLHCYLPCVAMGVPAQIMHPQGKSQNTWSCPNRFEGLLFNKEVGNISVPALVTTINSLTTREK